MNRKTNIRAYLSLFADRFPLEDVTNQLSIQPTHTYQKGERGIYAVKKETCWEYESETMETLYMDEPVDKLLDVFESKISIINALKEEYGLTIKLFVVIIIEKKDAPAIGINHRLVDFLHKIGAEIDIDQYIN